MTAYRELEGIDPDLEGDLMSFADEFSSDDSAVREGINKSVQTVTDRCDDISKGFGTGILNVNELTRDLVEAMKGDKGDQEVIVLASTMVRGHRAYPILSRHKPFDLAEFLHSAASATAAQNREQADSVLWQRSLTRHRRFLAGNTPGPELDARVTDFQSRLRERVGQNIRGL